MHAHLRVADALADKRPRRKVGRGVGRTLISPPEHGAYACAREKVEGGVSLPCDRTRLGARTERRKGDRVDRKQ